MGICSAKQTEEEAQAVKASSAIGKSLKKDMEEEKRVIKLLLLGTGESGKSTIFKQMQILYTSGFTDYEKTTYRHVVRRNVVESMQTLLTGAARFGFKLSSPEAENAAKFLLELDPLSAEFWVDEIVGHVKTLWQGREEAIKRTYEKRSKLQLPDSASYLFDNIDRIGKPDYIPDQQDILRARLRTSGIVERLFQINGVTFKFLDVGGQRNERRKWIHCFEDVTAVIFVVALSEYDQMLYEEEKENRLIESLHVFEPVCNNKYFAKTAMIIFFNKVDLFQEKLPRVPLSVCFPEYTGKNTFEEASKYIQDKFLAVNTLQKDMFCHFTCATDTNNVEKVFDDCKAVILRHNLQKLGLD